VLTRPRWVHALLDRAIASNRPMRTRAQTGARTCLECGVRVAAGKVRCEHCRAALNRHKVRLAGRRAQEATRGAGSEAKLPWTPEEDAVVLRTDLTREQAALLIGRSFLAVASRAGRLRRSRGRLGSR
jgi:hypothetical protein